LSTFLVNTGRDEQYPDTCIGDTYRAILLYLYRFSTSQMYQAGFSCIADTSISIPGCILALNDCLQILVI